MYNELTRKDILWKIKNDELTIEEGKQLLKKLKGISKVDEICFKELWQEEAILKEKTQEHYKYLIFDTNKTLNKYINKLPESQVIIIEHGKTFSKIEPNRYIINPQNKEEYEKLLNSLEERNFKTDIIIHNWSENDFFMTKESIESDLKTSFYSLLNLTQALLKNKVTNEIKLFYMAKNSIEAPNPVYSAITGFIKTVHNENPNFIYKLIGLDKLIDDKYLELLTNEVSSNNKAVEISYYKGARYIKSASRVDLGKKITGNHFKTGGVYLITGGLGGLGLIFTKYLMETYSAKIVLSGRSKLTEDRQSILKSFDKLLGEVKYIESDISNKDDVKRLIQQIKESYGKLNGIIHSAGVLRDSYIINKERAKAEEVISPKVYGTLYLDLFTQDEPLDLFIMFSSLAAVVGNSGQCDYSFANRFMDNFALLRNKLVSENRRSGKTLSINWPLWKEGGMRIDLQKEQLLKDTIGTSPLSTGKGIKLLEKSISTNESQIIVFEGDREKIEEILGIAEKDTSLLEKATEPESIDKLHLEQPVEQLIKNILSEETKIPISEILSNEQLESYGLDSLMIMRLTNKLEQSFGKLSKTLLFEYKTVSELKDYFTNNHKNKIISLFKIKPQKREIKVEPIQSKIETKVVPNSSQEHRKVKDIAIIGVSAHYPEANNLEEYWFNLKNGKDCIKEIPLERWDYKKYFNSDPDEAKKGKMYCKWGGFLSDVDKFDPLFFKISMREAEVTDPQERLFLQTTWELFENAGYSKQAILDKHDSNVGVFVGVTSHTYQLIGQDEWHKGNIVISNSFPWSIANRVSYFFNFQGPSLPVDTACSSSLVAIHEACESIKNGECSLAIAGGVNLYLHPSKYINLCQMKMLSPTGKCHSFGNKADGFVPGEGIGAILLKPLENAIQDNDNIYAVIKGTAINHDGKTNGFTVPNPAAQADVISQALKKAQIDPSTISYIEAHGTGTSLGDPIEIRGLTKAFRAFTNKKNYCAIGSSKSNIGHAEAAAGIAGVTKILLQMKYGKIVPSLHSGVLNPKLDLEDSPFYIQSGLTNWSNDDPSLPLRAGISSFGAGGVNSHLILEEYINYEKSHPELAQNAATSIVILSAKSRERLTEHIDRLLSFIKQYKSDSKIVESSSNNINKNLESELLRIAASILGISADEIDYNDNLEELGFDQFTLTQYGNLITERYNIDLTYNIFSECHTIKQIELHLIDKYGKIIENQPDKKRLNIRELAYTLQVGREEMEERIAILTSSVDDLIIKLEKYQNNPNELSNIYKGNIKKAKERSLLLDGDEGQEFVEKVIKKGNIEKVAQMWINGIKINWKQLYQVQPKRISLPTYPFEKERCWIEQIKENKVELTTSQLQQLHPLIDSNISTTEALIYKKVFHKNSPYIMDNYIQNKSYISASLLIEIIRRAAILSIKNYTSITLQDIKFAQPLIVTETALELKIYLYHEEEKINFEIFDSKNNNIVIKGRIILDESITKTDNVIPPESIIEKMKKNIKKDEIYSLLLENNINYGNNHMMLKELRYDENNSISYIKAPENINQLLLPTGIIEAVIQSITTLSLNENTGKTGYLYPTAIKNINLIKDYEDNCTIYTRRVKKSGKELEYDITILTKAGEVIADIQNLVLKRLAPADLKESSILKSSINIKEIFSQALKVNEEKLDETVPIEDFGIDSIILMEILQQIEKVLNKKLNLSNSISDLKTINDFIDFVNEKSNNNKKNEKVAEKIKLISWKKSKTGIIKNSENRLFIEKYNYAFRSYINNLNIFFIKSSQNMNIEIITAGSGEPIVLLPPLDGIGTAWMYQIAKLAENYRVIIFHYPGYGRSDFSYEHSDFDSITDNIIENMNIIESHRQFNLVGWSMGGIIAQKLYSRYSDRVKSLTLTNTTSRLDYGDQSIDTLTKVINNLRTDLVNNMPDELKQETELIVNSIKANYKNDINIHYFQELLSTDLRDDLKNISVPTLIITGEKDMNTPPEWGRFIHDNIKDSIYHEVKNAGHYIALHYSELFNKMLLDFLKS